ncbi:pyridoxal phosphate-dependent aminotransferase [Candidatus Peregrinibacteria bacterium]|nr:pyridoxal phosphate-dependent aminotransferase [Candidatus Peregrinibacteria bacterium]
MITCYQVIVVNIDNVAKVLEYTAVDIFPDEKRIFDIRSLNLFRNFIDFSMAESETRIADLFAKESPPMGVLALIEEARKDGFREEDSNKTGNGWINFSRGEAASNMFYPDENDPDASVEERRIKKGKGVDDYGPVAGITALREEYAMFYNRLHRSENGQDAFRVENVTIRPGGRPAIHAALAAFGMEGLGRGRNVRVGHFHPDYAGYLTPLKVVNGIDPVAIPLDRQSGYHIDVAELRKKIRELGLEVLLLSNPCNPTGSVIAGEELQKWVELSEETGAYPIIDEFYDEYVYDEEKTRVSSADYLGRIDDSRVVIVSGISKSLQAAGWRIAAVLGSKKIIGKINAVAGGLDGGANHPLQVATIPMLNSPRRDRTHKSRHDDFLEKRNRMTGHLKNIGVQLASEPKGTFYLWGDISDLVGDRDQLEIARAFMREKVIPWVPGSAFCVDTNDETRRRALPQYENLVRFSYGPRKDIMLAGLKRMKKVVNNLD